MNLAYLSDTDFIEKLTGITLANMGNENFSVSDLSREAGVNLNYLNSRLHKIKSITASRFICEVRLKKALELLKEHNFTAAEVAFKVGFGSATYFNKCFHEF